MGDPLLARSRQEVPRDLQYYLLFPLCRFQSSYPTRAFAATPDYGTDLRWDSNHS
jgi:hypothetical protein